MRSYPATTRLRPTDALGVWQNVLLETVRSDTPDLTTRQLSVLMCVYLDNTPHTVRSLATKLEVEKCVITRALNTLTRHKFVSRTPDPADKRSVLIRRTPQGSHYLTQFARLISDNLKDMGRPTTPLSDAPLSGAA